MGQYFINETYIAKQNQYLFYTEKPFVNNTISVFVNGTLQLFGEDKDYTTAPDTGTIVFNKKLNVGDIVSIVSNIASTRLHLEVISQGRSDKPNALYKKYGTVKRLKPNNKYEVCICINKDIFKWNFVSKLNPMFVSSKKIWEDIGEFIEGFTEEYINSMIYRHSVEVIELIDELANQEDAVTNVTYEIDEDGNYTTSNRTIKNWVKYKTEIALVMARYYGISLKYGTISKEVGDINIQRTVELPEIDALLSTLKGQLQQADDAIRGKNIVAYGVKGINNYTYDDWERTTNF